MVLLENITGKQNKVGVIKHKYYMLTKDFIVEKKRKRKMRMRKYFFPGYGYFAGSSDSSEGGGESIYEGPEIELAKTLPSLQKHDYTTIDQLVKKISSKYRISDKALNDLFVRKFKKTPDSWINNKLDEDSDLDIEEEVEKFVEWASKILKLKTIPEIELSQDTEEAQTNHHTGSHVDKTNKVWVYVKNRNLVDILRTVFHELVHVRQGELDMIKPGSSYPGSPIEAMADKLAGKYIKIYGEQHHYIFQ